MQIEVTPEMREAASSVAWLYGDFVNSRTEDWLRRSIELQQANHTLAQLVIAAIEEQEQGESSHV